MAVKGDNNIYMFIRLIEKDRFKFVGLAVNMRIPQTRVLVVHGRPGMFIIVAKTIVTQSSHYVVALQVCCLYQTRKLTDKILDSLTEFVTLKLPLTFTFGDNNLTVICFAL